MHLEKNGQIHKILNVIWESCAEGETDFNIQLEFKHNSRKRAKEVYLTPNVRFPTPFDSRDFSLFPRYPPLNSSNTSRARGRRRSRWKERDEGEKCARIYSRYFRDAALEVDEVGALGGNEKRAAQERTFARIFGRR